MKSSRKLAIFLFSTIFASSCSFFSDKNKEKLYGIEAYSQEKINSIIDNHPYTIILMWTPFCGPCQNTIIDHVVPYLANKPDSIGFISITSYKSEEIIYFMENQNCKLPTFMYKDGDTITNPYLGFYHYLLPTIIEDYEHEYRPGGVPHTILCNNKREILNIDKDGVWVSRITGDTIPGIHYYPFAWCIEHLNEIISK